MSIETFNGLQAIACLYLAGVSLAVLGIFLGYVLHDFFQMLRKWHQTRALRKATQKARSGLTQEKAGCWVGKAVARILLLSLGTCLIIWGLCYFLIWLWSWIAGAAGII